LSVLFISMKHGQANIR